jgi:hypothetical protein
MKDKKGPQDDIVLRMLGYMEGHKNEMRTVEDYSNILDFSHPKRIHAGLSQHHHKHGILKVTKVDKDGKKYFYGVSDQCGEHSCYYTWCHGYSPDGKRLACPLGRPNPDLKFLEL